MGRDKATIEFQGERLVDRLINRFRTNTDRLFLSARHDYNTGIAFITDDPDTPAGPVGGIFSIAGFLAEHHPDVQNFITVPVDAPFAPNDLAERLSSHSRCMVSSTADRLQPAFALWQCSVVSAVRHTHDMGSKAPSLHWLARQCDADIVEWGDPKPFINMNTPEDLQKAGIQKACT